MPARFTIVHYPRNCATTPTLVKPTLNEKIVRAGAAATRIINERSIDRSFDTRRSRNENDQVALPRPFRFDGFESIGTPTSIPLGRIYPKAITPHGIEKRSHLRWKVAIFPPIPSRAFNYPRISLNKYSKICKFLPP